MPIDQPPVTPGDDRGWQAVASAPLDRSRSVSRARREGTPAMPQDDSDLLASADDVRNLTDPQDSLQALVSGIGQLQEQIQAVHKQHTAEQPQQPTEQEKEKENADDPYRLSARWGAREAKQKHMSSMLLARPPVTAVPDDLERLLLRLKREIKTIETSLVEKMDSVERQIQKLPDAQPKRKDEPAELKATDAKQGARAESDDLGVDTDAMERARGTFEEAAAMERLAAEVKPEDMRRTIWAGHIPSEHAETDEMLDKNIRTWFEPFGRIDHVKLRRKDRSAGEYKSYCLITFSTKGGKDAALAAGVRVTRTKMSLDDDRVDLSLKEVDGSKELHAPVGAARQKHRMQVLQRACETYDKFLNPDRSQPHETVIEGFKALAAMQKSAGMAIEAQATLSKVQSLQSIVEKQQLREANQGSASPDAARNASPTRMSRKWCDDD